MDSQSFNRLPKQLLEMTNLDDRRFLRRAVAALSATNIWELVCCTVQEILPPETVSGKRLSHRYAHASLHEDVLNGSECLQFAVDIDKGAFKLGDIVLQRGQMAQWQVEQLPVNNIYMERTGYVVSQVFTRQAGTYPRTRLLAPDRPFFPDVYAAVQQYLPLRDYHQDRDGRNGQVHFLLPEVRAYVAEATLSDQGELNISVAGEGAGMLWLRIKGAYWVGKTMHQLDTPVSNLKALLTVALEAERLEYYLIDEKGTVYDSHREDSFSRFGPGSVRLRPARRGLASQVEDAREAGEGSEIEFKPFISPDQGMGTPSEKTKLRELVTTVVAFANTAGGRIYLGIDDDGTITGTGSGLATWAKDKVDDAALAKYTGALKSRIRSYVYGDVALQIEMATVRGALVAVIEVPRADPRPVAIVEDQHLYVRKGATNRKLPPDQWKSALLTP